jgi:hypothetical protein
MIDCACTHTLFFRSLHSMLIACCAAHSLDLLSQCICGDIRNFIARAALTSRHSLARSLVYLLTDRRYTSPYDSCRTRNDAFLDVRMAFSRLPSSSSGNVNLTFERLTTEPVVARGMGTRSPVTGLFDTPGSEWDAGMVFMATGYEGPPPIVNSDVFVNGCACTPKCHLNAHGMTPTNTGGAYGSNAALRSSLCGPFFTSVCDVHTLLCVYKHTLPQVRLATIRAIAFVTVLLWRTSNAWIRGVSRGRGMAVGSTGVRTRSLASRRVCFTVNIV